MARILIAEDDPTYSRVLGRLLAAAGHDIEVVADGETAVARIRQNVPDLALLDVIMPGLDGFSVARAVKADPRTALVQVLFITGATDTHHKIQGLEAGANDYITKPFHRTELMARISVAVRIHELQGELRQKNAELEEQARTDPLTGLANRRLFDERLEQEVVRAHRYRHPLSALMIDLDHFKAVNDAILHEGGDQVLCAVAECLRQHVRANDLVARTGGEEFVLICPETPLEGAEVLAERIRVAIAELHPVGAISVPITTSVGVATLPPGSAMAGKDLIHAADVALREAKHAGRNRVTIGE